MREVSVAATNAAVVSLRPPVVATPVQSGAFSHSGPTFIEHFSYQRSSLRTITAASRWIRQTLEARIRPFRSTSPHAQYVFEAIGHSVPYIYLGLVIVEHPGRKRASNIANDTGHDQGFLD